MRRTALLLTSVALLTNGLFATPARASHDLVITILPVTEATPVGTWAAFQVFARDEAGNPFDGTLQWATGIESVHLVSGSVSLSRGWGRFGYTGSNVGQDVVQIVSNAPSSPRAAAATRVWYRADANVASTTPARVIFDDPFVESPADGQTRLHGFRAFNAAGATITNRPSFTAVVSGVNGPRTFNGTLDFTGYGVVAYPSSSAGIDEIVVTVGQAAGSATRAYGLTYADPGDVPDLPPADLAADCLLPVSPLDEDIDEPVDSFMHPMVALGSTNRFDMNNDSNGDNVADGFIKTGSNDFPSGGYAHNQHDSQQDMTIFSSASVDPDCGARGGDVGIYRQHDAEENNVYSAKTRVRITSETDQEEVNFYARMTFHFLRANGSIIKGKECNQKLFRESLDGSWSVLEEPACVMPDGTEGFRINVRAHAKPKNAQEGNYRVAGWGTVEVDWLEFTYLSRV